MRITARCRPARELSSRRSSSFARRRRGAGCRTTARRSSVAEAPRNPSVPWVWSRSRGPGRPASRPRPSHARLVGRLGSAGSGGFGLVRAVCEAAWYPWWSWSAQRMFSRRPRRVVRSGMWWCVVRGRMRCVAGTVWWTVLMIWVSSRLRVEVCAPCSLGAGGGWALRAGRRAPSAVRRGTVGWAGAARNRWSGCTGSETPRGL